MANISIPCALVRPNRIIQYSYWDGDRARRSAIPISNKQKSTISNKASKRLESTIYLLCQSATTKRVWDKDWQKWFSFKINFITLTLPSPQIHADTDIYHRIFKPFVRWWRAKNPNLLYIWKAEKQDNGNIHFHITTNSFIHWRTLRTHWNKCCDSLGYCQRYTGNDPNSTDVHSVRNIRSLPKYLASYMTKKDLYKSPLKRWHKRHGQYLKNLESTSFLLPKNYYKNIKSNVTCKHWDASKILLNNKCTVISEQAQFQYDLNLLQHNNVESVITDYCRIWNIRANHWTHLKGFKAAYDEFISEIRKRNRLTVAIN